MHPTGINVNSPLEIQNSLDACCSLQWKYMLKSLTEVGDNVNWVNIFGGTALERAIASRYLDEKQDMVLQECEEELNSYRMVKNKNIVDKQIKTK